LARKEFTEHYGGFMEIMYLLCKGDFAKMEEVDKWKTSKFLYLGEYLLRKKNVENIE